jgi:hypothetical protein
MIRSIGTFFVICSLCLATVQTSVAHDRAYERRESAPHYRATIHRDRHMPRWLVHDRGFRYWYRRTSLRHNHYLEWWQLYEIFRWERRYDQRRHAAVYYGSQHHDHDWYRRYWHKHDRRHDDRRRHPKHKRRRNDD